MYKALSTLKMGLQKHLVPNISCIHIIEPDPHHLCGLTNWLGRLIGFPLPHIETGYFIFWCAMFCPMASHKGKI